MKVTTKETVNFTVDWTINNQVYRYRTYEGKESLTLTIIDYNNKRWAIGQDIKAFKTFVEEVNEIAKLVESVRRRRSEQ